MSKSKTLVVKLPRNVLEIVDFGRKINDSLTENSSLFPNLPISLSTFLDHINTLAEAEASTKQTAQGIIVRDTALEQLTSDIKRLASYVQLLVDNNPSTAELIIKMSGFSIRQPYSGKGNQPYEITSEESGMVMLSAPANSAKFPYIWEISTDNVNWVFFKASRLSLAKAGPLVSGVLYYFRYYRVGEDNEPEQTSAALSCRVR